MREGYRPACHARWCPPGVRPQCGVLRPSRLAWVRLPRVLMLPWIGFMRLCPACSRLALLAALEAILSHPACVPDERYRAAQRLFFQHGDAGNSRRLVERLRAAIAARSPR